MLIAMGRLIGPAGPGHLMPRRSESRARTGTTRVCDYHTRQHRHVVVQATRDAGSACENMREYARICENM